MSKRHSQTGTYHPSLESAISCAWDFVSGVAVFLISVSLARYPDIYTVFIQGTLASAILSGLILSSCTKLMHVPSCRYHMPISLFDLTVTGVISAILASSLFIGLHVLLFLKIPGRYFLLDMLLLMSAFVVLPRILFFLFFPISFIKIAVLGTGRSAVELADSVQGTKSIFQLVGCFSVPSSGQTHMPAHLHVPVLGGFDKSCFPEDLKKLGVEGLVLCLEDENSMSHEEQRVLFHLPVNNIHVLHYGAFIERYFHRIPVGYLNIHWLTSFFALYASPHAFLIKRVIDLALVTIGLLLYAPLFPFIAMAVYFTDGGSVFFKQTRVGKDSVPFTLFKIRTMNPDAEINGPQWAEAMDPRVTRIGRWLRKTRLDEFPQLFNVLRGEMSVVGPRPERPEFEEYLIGDIPLYERRHMVLPGLTGWAQVRHGYGASVEDARQKLEYDLYYIKHFSNLFDIRIIFLTLVLIWRGSR